MRILWDLCGLRRTHRLPVRRLGKPCSTKVNHWCGRRPLLADRQDRLFTYGEAEGYGLYIFSSSFFFLFLLYHFPI